MNYTAKPTAFNPVLIAGNTPSYLSNASFTLYEDESSIGQPGVDDTVNLSSLPANWVAIEFNCTASLRVTPYKHVNSTSLDDDAIGGHANTYSEDLQASKSIQLTGYVLHNGNHYEFNFDIYYYPAINTPNISISRIANVLGSGSNTVAGNSAAGQINMYSPFKPNKAAPHGLGEFIKYAHLVEGNVKLLGIPSENIVIPWELIQQGYYIPFQVLRMPVLDAGLDASMIVLQCGSDTTNINLSSDYTRWLSKYITMDKKSVALKIYNGSQYVTIASYTLPLTQEAKPFTINSFSVQPLLQTVKITLNITSSEAVQLYVRTNTTICDDAGNVTGSSGLLPSAPLGISVAQGTANYTLTINSGITEVGQNVHSVFVQLYSDNIGSYAVDSDNWQNPSFG